MKIFYFYRKRVMIILLMLVLVGVIIGGIYAIRRSTRYQEVDHKSSEVIEQTQEEELSSQKEIEYTDFVTGKDILTKYSEVKNTEYAILVATTKYLEADPDLITEEAEYPYIKYVIEEGHQNIAETTIDHNGFKVILSFINYNSVLKNGAILHTAGSYLYETTNGFMEEDIIVESIEEADDMATVTYQAVFPLINREESINYISRDAIFKEAVLVDINAKVIGSIYIEQGEDTIDEGQ
ncbi:MAG: hypothetical protein K0R34_675 [Herbinix sp.]|jgi:hypothetical protein|nr:hypothetical protein [Herbinix sp.]